MYPVGPGFNGQRYVYEGDNNGSQFSQVSEDSFPLSQPSATSENDFEPARPGSAEPEASSQNTVSSQED